MFQSEAADRKYRWQGDPFALNDDAAYKRWRKEKLDAYPVAHPDSGQSLMVEVRDAANPTAGESAEIRSRCSRMNMALFHDAKGRLKDRSAFRKFAAALGLARLSPHLLADPDGIASITPTSRQEVKGEYIPYTTRPLNWHTDGYYADGDNTIRGFALYCVRAAETGGISALLDPEIAYIRLRDRDPAHIAAFCRPDAMTIPANIQDGVEIRPAQSGPVFSANARDGQLTMRYTARTVSIVWPDDAEMTAARAALDDILASESVLHYRLRPGDGLVCNNVLHRRSAFDDPDRLLYRGRFLDRITETE